MINGIFSIILFHVLYRTYTNLKLASEFFHFRNFAIFFLIINLSLQCSLIFFPIWSASNFNFFLYKSQFFHPQFTVPIKRVLALKQAKKKKLFYSFVISTEYIVTYAIADKNPIFFFSMELKIGYLSAMHWHSNQVQLCVSIAVTFNDITRCLPTNCVRLVSELT